MTKDKKSASKTNKDTLSTLNLIGNANGMVCGPNGCSLADHFKQTKKDKNDKK